MKRKRKDETGMSFSIPTALYDKFQKFIVKETHVRQKRLTARELFLEWLEEVTKQIPEDPPEPPHKLINSIS